MGRRPEWPTSQPPQHWLDLALNPRMRGRDPNRASCAPGDTVRNRAYGEDQCPSFQSHGASNNLTALGFWLTGAGRLGCRNLLPACLQIEAAERSIRNHSRGAKRPSLGAEGRDA